MGDELLPCPFCGQQPKVFPASPETDGNAWTAIECANCVSSPSTQSVARVMHYADSGHFEAAAAAWNTRPRPALSGDDAGLIEALRAWGPLIASGYEVPAAGQRVLDAAARIEALSATITAQADEVERLREAVAFYAKDYNWLASSMYVFGLDGKSIAETDRGDIARAALKAAQEVKA